MFNNKRGVSTFVIGFIFFYSFLALLGILYLNSNLVASDDINDFSILNQSLGNIDAGDDDSNVDRKGISNYLRNLVITFDDTPWWLYLILFTPLIAIVLYAVFVDVI